MTAKHKPEARPARRRWLVGGVVGAGIVALGSWWHRRRSNPSARVDRLQGLEAWVDTLLPADGELPGAIALGAHQAIEASGRRNATLGALHAAGLDWADAQARSHGAPAFAALTRAQREDVVARAQHSPEGSAPRVFFQSTLDDTFFLHYSDPRSWPALGYDGPPQPRGFPDHAQAPRT